MSPDNRSVCPKCGEVYGEIWANICGCYRKDWLCKILLKSWGKHVTIAADSIRQELVRRIEGKRKMHPLNCVGECKCSDAIYNQALDEVIKEISNES